MHIDRSSVPYLVDEISTIESDTFYIPFCPGNQLYLLEGRVFDFYCLFFHNLFSKKLHPANFILILFQVPIVPDPIGLCLLRVNEYVCLSSDVHTVLEEEDLGGLELGHVERISVCLLELHEEDVTLCSDNDTIEELRRVTDVRDMEAVPS